VTALLEISTPRLLMRQWRTSDRREFARLNADARVMRHFPSVLDRAASDAMARRIEMSLAERGWGLWALEVPGIARFIGFVGLSVPLVTLPFSPCVEVGWRLAFEHWGRGYATEGARAALLAAFEWLDLEEIVSFTALANRRSRNVMERIGMKPDEGGDFAHPALAADHECSRHCLYRIGRLEWSDPDATAQFRCVA
jgi:RimJ/RimL family protein N-acetyltransferase